MEGSGSGLGEVQLSGAASAGPGAGPLPTQCRLLHLPPVALRYVLTSGPWTWVAESGSPRVRVAACVQAFVKRHSLCI